MTSTADRSTTKMSDHEITDDEEVEYDEVDDEDDLDDDEVDEEYDESVDPEDVPVDPHEAENPRIHDEYNLPEYPSEDL